MAYSLKEIFLSLQGEGIQSGKTSLFCRFSGCNLWNGLEKDRLKAECRFCDTDFIGCDGKKGGKYPTPDALADQLDLCWREGTKGASERKYVIFTGGEPLLQLDAALLNAVKKRGFQTAVETNGSVVPKEGVLDLLDWVCVSPKTKTLAVTKGDELKFVFPQSDLSPEAFESFAFDHFILQPMDNENYHKNTAQALRYCLQNPKWRLGLQLHKILDIA